MIRKTFTTITAATMLVSMLTPVLSFGQTNEPKIKENQTITNKSLTAKYPEYLQNLSQTAVLNAGLEQETEKLANTLISKERRGMILTDEDGSRRFAAVENLAYQIANGKTTNDLIGKNIFKINLAKIVADSKNEADLTAKLAEVLSYAEKISGTSMFYVEDYAAFSAETPDFGKIVSDRLRSAIAVGKIKFITTGKTVEFASAESTDKFLKDNFRQVDLKESLANSEDDFVGDKISPEIRDLMGKAGKNEKVEVILQSDDISNPELLAVLKRNQVKIESQISGLNMMVVDLPVAAAETVANLQSAKHLSLNNEVASLGHIAVTTGMATMRSQPGNLGLDGSGIGIAIVDSGVYEKHESFWDANKNDRVVKSVDFTGESGTNNDPYGHGSHVAGLAAGSIGDNAALVNYVGIATNAKIINVRVLKGNGTGTSAKLLQGIDWILANRAANNIRVVNMSLGTPAVESYRNDPLCRAVRKLVDAGIVVVAAAGNNGKDATGAKQYGSIHSPGNEPSVITVGASNTFGTDARNDDGIATYSSRGPTRSFYTNASGTKVYDQIVKPELVAPGNKLISVASDKNYLMQQNPQLKMPVAGTASDEMMMQLSGTSMASPIVTGTVALMLQANPKLTPNMVKMILQYTAQPLAGFNQLEQGAGEINVEGAIRLTRQVKTTLTNSTQLGEPMLNGTMLPRHSSTIGGTNFQWAGGITTNYGLITGTSLITKYQKIYNLGVLIGDGIMMSDGVLIGDGIMMSDGVLIGDGIMMSDGVLIGDGIMMSDGVLIGDTIGSANLGSKAGLKNGKLFIASRNLYDSNFSQVDNTVWGDGIMMSDGVLFGDGWLAGDTVSFSNSAAVNGDATGSMK